MLTSLLILVSAVLIMTAAVLVFVNGKHAGD